MHVYYHFQSENVIPYKELLHLINANYHDEFTLHPKDKYTCYILAEPKFYDTLLVLLPLINNDLGLIITCLICHKNDLLANQALSILNRYQGNGIYHLATLLLDLISLGDHRLDGLIKKEIEMLDREIILTAIAFIQSGLNATRAAKKLYVHRNTFNYRMDKFIQETNLNIRDFHQALFFMLALKISGHN